MSVLANIVSFGRRRTAGFPLARRFLWRKTAQKATPSEIRRHGLLRRGVLGAVVFLPTILAVLYYGSVAADQYVSEAHFLVRSAASPETTPGFAALMQLGIGRSQDDSFAVNDFIISRDAVARLKDTVNLEKIYGAADADFLAKYPSILYGPTEEELFLYYQRMISVAYKSGTGITMLQVRAFRAEDAQAIASLLLEMGERLVNQVNGRIQKDAVSNSETQLGINQARMIDAQIALATFRNRELMIDPARNAVSLGELISKLSTELAQTKAQIAEMLTTSAGSPQVPNLRRRIAALEGQIAQERGRIGNNVDGLAERIAIYDRLILDKEISNRMLIASEAELTRARAEARRQQLYLVRIVQPQLADYATQPKRLGNILTVFGCNVIAFLIIWLLFTGMVEHGVQHRK